MTHRWLTSSKAIVLTPLLLALVFIIACGGSAATSAPVATAVAQQAQPTAVTAQQAQPTTGAATQVPGIVIATPTPRPAIQPVAAAVVRAGKYGGFINMIQYADVRQRLVHQSSILNMNLGPLLSMLVEYNSETDDFTDLRCDLCTSWELAADGKTYTFRLNKDAEWWDGEPVTSRDVVFMFESIINPDQYPVLEGRSTSATVNHEVYVDSGSARAVDDYTFEVTTKFPSGAFLAAIAAETGSIQAAHTVLDQGIVQGGRDLSAINGSGPYKFVEYVKGVSVEYERWDNYWKEGLPYIDGMKHFIIGDPGRVIAAFKTGQILMPNWGSNLTPLEAQKLDEEMDNLTVHWGETNGNRNVLVNTTKAPFDDWRVRQAIHLALYRQAIIQSDSGGKLPVGYNIPEGYWFSRTAEEYANLPGYRELNGEKHPDDLAAARQLLLDAGIPEGTKITLTARNCCGYPDQGVLIKEQLQDFLGFDITIRVLEPSAGFDAYWAGDFEMMIQGLSMNYGDPDALMTKNVRGTSPQWVGGGRGKFFSLPGMEDLFDVQKQELDAEKRKALVHQMGDILQNEGAAIFPIYWGVRFMPVEHRIQNFHIAEWNKKWEYIWCDPAC
jgi:peptide/nickel transport system substrate-binding protein